MGPRKGSGLSLIEVAVSAVVLVIGVMGLTALQLVAGQAQTRSFEITAPIEFGREQLSELKETPSALLADSAGILNGEPASEEYADLLGAIDARNTENFARIGDVDYIRVWSAQPITSHSNFKTIRLWVFWRDHAGQSHNIQLVSEHQG